jgi:Domain of unknown function (DUF4157)/Annexin
MYSVNKKTDTGPGNNAVPAAIQTKLAIGAVNDPLETEADAMADTVMRMPAAISSSPPDGNIITGKASDTTIRKCAKCDSDTDKEEKARMKPLASSITPFIQTKSNGEGIASDALSSRISNSRGNGSQMDGETKTFMESRFGTDFSGVKIHTGNESVQMNRELNAKAFTVGNDIYFNEGQYNTGSESGKHLLAHELTHTVQQNQAYGNIQRKPSLISVDLNDIAEKVHRAIDRVGTDEEAVYGALQRLERDKDSIQAVSDIYLNKYGDSLEADIRGDFSEEELQYALELIGITPLVAEELIGGVPVSDSDYEFAAGKLYKAMDQWGTNEEAIYGMLIAMENVPERIAKLKAAYTKKYPAGLHGGDLEYDIRDEMSGSELDYALLLLNVIPQGNTAILAWIRDLISKDVKPETIAEVMRSLDRVNPDRLRVIVVDMIRKGDLVTFKNKIVNVAGTDFTSLVSRIAVVEAEFADPAKNTVAASAGQKAQITDILNQGMNVDPVTKTVLAFKDEVAGRFYKQDIEETLEKEVTSLTPRALARAALPKFGWPRYDEIANEAKKRTDAVFGHYKMGDALTSAVGPDRNLFDFSQEAFSDAALLHFANYLVTGHNAHDPVYPGKTIHQVHNADLTREPEKTFLREALNNWFIIPGNKSRLLEVNKNWTGAQSGGNIFLQRWDVGNLDKNRAQFWKNFQTMIHEYLHKITDTTYSTKARSLGRTKEQVYTEGGTSYFDERVWKTLYPEEVRADPTLREKVEGGVYPYNSQLVPADSAYEQIDQFKQIVNVVGEDNAAAAYFLGKTDRIGL